jgi:hypothetical protein
MTAEQIKVDAIAPQAPCSGGLRATMGNDSVLTDTATSQNSAATTHGNRDADGADSDEAAPPCNRLAFPHVFLSKTSLTIVRLLRKCASILFNESAFTASRIVFFAAIADIWRFCSTIVEPLLERIPASRDMNSRFYYPIMKTRHLSNFSKMKSLPHALTF